MKAWSLFTAIMLAVCLGVAGCAHKKDAPEVGGARGIEDVNGAVVSYGVYDLKMKLMSGEPTRQPMKKLNSRVQIVPVLREQSDIIPIDSIKKSQFGYEFIINGCGQRQISADFIMKQGGQLITRKTLQLRCGRKRMLTWGGWKDLKAQGRLNEPIYFSAEYEGKQLFKFDVTFTEGQSKTK